MTTTEMTWDGRAFLVSIRVRLDRRVCNPILIFISPPSPSPFFPSDNITLNVAAPYYSARTAAKDDAITGAGEAYGKGAAARVAAAEPPPSPPSQICATLLTITIKTLSKPS